MQSLVEKIFGSVNYATVLLGHAPRAVLCSSGFAACN